MTSPVPPPSRPERLRVGVTAAALDTVVAVACWTAASRLRVAAADLHAALPLTTPALFVASHVLASAAVRLYAPGARLWPLRLVAGALAGVIVGVLLARVLPPGAVPAGQAVGAYIFGVVLGALCWRAAAGLGGRWRALAALDPGADALEERGVQYRSMAGGLLAALRYRHLLRNLIAKDLTLKYRGSVLGFLWSLANPVAMIAVYTFAFTTVLRVPTPRYPFFVLVGLTAWTFFASAVSGSTGAIADAGSLLKSVVFPRVILPVAGVAFALVQYLLTVAVLLPALLLWHATPPGPQLLAFPAILALQVIYVTGLALLLATATAFLRDLKHLVEVGLALAFWATPVIYEFALVPEGVRPLVLLGPMTAFVLAYQDIFYYGAWPPAAVWLVAITYAVTAFVCGLSVFVAYEDRFAERT